MFYSADKTEDLSLGHRISDNSEGVLQRGKWRGGVGWGEPGYRGVFETKTR